jgi:hypothetical protein
MARTLVRAETQIDNSSSILGETGWFLRSDGSVALSGDLDLGEYRIVNVGEPLSAGDVATKSYVDSVASGLDIKRPCRAKTHTNVTLLGGAPLVVDGVTLAEGDRILVNGQDLPTENGIYEVSVEGTGSTGTWVRSSDANTSDKVNAGLFTFVTEGSLFEDTGWVLITNDPIVLGTTPLEFSQFTGVADIVAGDGLSLTGNVLDIVPGDNSLLVTNTDIVVNVDGESLVVGLDGVSVQIHPSSTLQSTSTGLKVSEAQAGYILVGQGAGEDTVFIAISGDATLDAEGVLTLTKSFLEVSKYVVREVPAGIINNSNTVFTLSLLPVTGSEMVFLNGTLLHEGTTNDYTIDGLTLTLNFAPRSAPGNPDRLLVTYLAQ